MEPSYSPPCIAAIFFLLSQIKKKQVFYQTHALSLIASTTPKHTMPLWFFSSSDIRLQSNNKETNMNNF